jgi:hypothetical protein
MNRESSSEGPEEELTKAVRVIKIASLVAFLIVLSMVVTIAVSGFLPANKRSKMTLLRGRLRWIESDIKEYVSVEHTKIPTSWAELYDRWDKEIPSAIRDPFQRSGNMDLRSDSDRIVVWSVGPNGEDDLRMENGEVDRVDEIVLIVEYREGVISSKTLGLQEY